MRRGWTVPLLLLLAGPGCSDRYTCPDPIGPIIRDECAVYANQYESLAVSLRASVGPMGVGVSAGKQSLRDPSELIQLLKQQTLALCKDFNTCRVPPLQYRNRREESDRKYTAILAIQQQLEHESEAENKRRLVTALINVLSAGLEQPRPAGRPFGASCHRDKECADGLGCCRDCTSGEYERVPGRSHVRYVPGHELPWGRCRKFCFPCR